MTMVSSYVWRGLQRAVITLGMAFMIIGVVLLTVSERVYILGICFLSAGALAIIFYLSITLSSCFKKSNRQENVENPVQTEVRHVRQQQYEADPTQFEAPRYEDLTVIGTATVWTVTLGPPPDIEPPSYNIALDHVRARAPGNMRLTNPTLLRIRSDIHEFKKSGFIQEARFPEPITPPPAYNDSMVLWDDVFLPSHEEG